MWVLEVIRAAVLAEATEIRVHGDADDVIVVWDGPPIEDLERLLDELVGPAPAPSTSITLARRPASNTALSGSRRVGGHLWRSTEKQARRWRRASRRASSSATRTARRRAPASGWSRVRRRRWRPPRGMVGAPEAASPSSRRCQSPARRGRAERSSRWCGTASTTSPSRSRSADEHRPDRWHVNILRVASAKASTGSSPWPVPARPRGQVSRWRSSVRLALYGIALAPQTSGGTPSPCACSWTRRGCRPTRRARRCAATSRRCGTRWNALARSCRL